MSRAIPMTGPGWIPGAFTPSLDAQAFSPAKFTKNCTDSMNFVNFASVGGGVAIPAESRIGCRGRLVDRDPGPGLRSSGPRRIPGDGRPDERLPRPASISSPSRMSIEALFEAQNRTGPDRTEIAATYLRVTVLKA